MVGMPVATLRIWEQRYQAVRPITAASGHRLYSAADVERVTLLRRLTEQGHAIGLLAPLDIEQLRKMMRAEEAVGSVSPADASSTEAVIRVVTVGRALAHRLQRLDERLPNGLFLQLVSVYDSLAGAVKAAEHFQGSAVDLLLWQAGSVQSGAGSALSDAQAALRAPATGVVYRHGNAAGRAELLKAGAAVLQEPADDESLGRWLASLKRAPTVVTADSRSLALGRPGDTGLLQRAVLAPRFEETALTEFAGLSSALACECPGHLAELLLQISSFETYSGECANRSAADAQLHAYLQRVAGTARMLFEAALEQVAVAEGLPLPVSPRGGSSLVSPDASRISVDYLRHDRKCR
jgi:DNA-binding transcriptional MerR regulator